jgi:tRNA (guanosine-2'-O-)-methyltransferase
MTTPARDDARAIARLEPLVSEARRRRLQAVLASRSDHVTFVFEQMIDPHNLSAALRSLDAFSFQDVHLVRPGERLGVAPEEGGTVAHGITIGADRWLTLHSVPGSAACLANLKLAGYTVLASHLGAGDVLPLSAVDFSRRTALVFGNEHLGVSPEVLAQADGAFRIETHGFAQSLNLSVAVAISAFHAREAIARLAATDPRPERFGLDAERRRSLYAHWLRLSVRQAGRILGEGDEADDGATDDTTDDTTDGCGSARPDRSHF